MSWSGRLSRAIGGSLALLGATCAFGGAYASGAAPEVGRCVKVPAGTGAWGNAGCTLAGGSSRYEWQAGAVEAKFTTVLKAGTQAAVGENSQRQSVTCTGESGSGEYSGASTVTSVSMTFTGCQSSGFSCTSAGRAAGEIVLSSLEGEIGIITKSSEGPRKDKAGLDLFPPGHSGTVDQFNCVGSSAVVTGSVIVPVQADSMHLTPLLKFKASAGRQKPERFEGQEADVLFSSINGQPPQQSGVSSELLQTNEEKLEINMVI